MTETRNGEAGELPSAGLKRERAPNEDAALAAVMATIPARISRRANWTGMTAPRTASDNGTGTNDAPINLPPSKRSRVARNGEEPRMRWKSESGGGAEQAKSS